jgi:hypothetical protein
MMRLSKKLASLAFASATVLLSTQANAQKVKGASSQNFAIELRFSPYYPKVDSEAALGGQTPFKNVFGDSNRLMCALEFDWQALRLPHFGTLGPGISAGYTKMGSVAKIRGSTKDSAQETNLEIYPLYAVAVLRVDAIANELRFPIVPYAKAGLGLGLWRAYGPKGTENVKGTAGKGISSGTQLAIGAALQLDFLDRKSANDLDGAIGINHSYLFAEYFLSNLDGFGSNKALRVGTNTWTLGLAFEF